MRVSGPNGQTFDAVSECADTLLWGLTPEEVAQVMWVGISSYVAATIATLIAPTTATPPGSLDVPVVFG